MQLGELELTTISGGTLRLDGGTMFGVVPKVLWEQQHPADARNRIPLETNCLLVTTPSSRILVDTGFGTKASAKERRRFAFSPGSPLVDNLRAAGVEPGDVDCVILTHLHFDHAGGCTYRDADGLLRPTFPRARHVVQRAEWEDAMGHLRELKGAYFPEELQVLADAGLVETLDGSREVQPGVAVELTGGHTRGHQILHLGTGDARAVYLGDICPLVSHLRVFWTMAYEQHQLEVRRAKMSILPRAASEGWIVLFDHDPHVTAATLRQESDDEWAVAELVAL